MVVVPGGAYRYVSPSEGDIVARRFYEKGYNVFVLAYTVNYLDEPLKMQPLNDISRAVRIIRWHAEKLHICLLYTSPDHTRADRKAEGTGRNTQ